MRSQWISSLELNVPASLNIDAKYIAEYRSEKKDQFHEIDAFIQIVTDWLNDVLVEAKDNQPKEVK